MPFAEVKEEEPKATGDMKQKVPGLPSSSARHGIPPGSTPRPPERQAALRPPQAFPSPPPLPPPPKIGDHQTPARTLAIVPHH